MNKKQTYDKLVFSSYPNISQSKIISYNNRVDDYNNICLRFAETHKKILKMEAEQQSKDNRLMMVLGVIIFLVIAMASNDFLAGFWAILIAPILVGVLRPSIADGERKELSTSESRAKDLERTLLRELSEFNSIEKSVKISIFKQNAEYWLNMSGWEFEKQVARLYETHGYNSVITKGSADGGVDIFLKKDGLKYAVQCKNHRKPVGPASVRDLYGAMRHERVSKGIFISSNGYTTGAREFSLNKPIELLDISDIILMHNSK